MPDRGKFSLELCRWASKSPSPESCLLLQLGYLSTQASLAEGLRSACSGRVDRSRNGPHPLCRLEVSMSLPVVFCPVSPT
ncbi:hypothetical protein BCV69DRAFT_211573 [Microstroma glucosiphilum]|uniref:Uncharacterized protein n=1 Tax=Pseudomicrostroma glucosiphilum TaxID=1684307 RepID=A0A316U813_9BASI|nr:hypothetical protein BCV69DRAFT_211573 [Pseudomicrostroma glucosiphilum]PWN20503.1 hypothetical protein BCV69DRAFT_211573 [Pseudomicrostroma glucosiphilum]